MGLFKSKKPIQNNVDAENEFKLGMDFYNSGNVKEAAIHLKLAADNGNVYAMNFVAGLYTLTNGTFVSYDEAIKYYKMSEKITKDPEIQCRLGSLYAKANSMSNASYWWTVARTQNYPEAYVLLGDYEQSKNNYPKAIDYYEKAHNITKEPILLYKIGMAYFKLKDVNKTLNYFSLSAEKGCVEAQCGYGILLENRDRNESIKWLQIAAQNGSEDAESELKELNISVKPTNSYKKTESDKEEETAIRFEQIGRYDDAIKHHLIAANQGNPCAQINLALCYYEGGMTHVRDPNYSEAFKWFTIVSKNKNKIDSQISYYLGICYKYGHGTEISYENAFNHLQHAANLSDIDVYVAAAQEELGIMYYYGYYVERSITEAYKWLDKSAKNGNENASETLKQLKNKN